MDVLVVAGAVGVVVGEEVGVGSDASSSWKSSFEYLLKNTT
jgi:hypothetical protein